MKHCTLPDLVSLAIRAVKDGIVGVGLVKSHTSWERLAPAGHQGGGRQAGVARRRHRALAAPRQSRHMGRRRALCAFGSSGGSRLMGGASWEGIDLAEVLDVFVSHSELSLKLGYVGSEGEDLVFHRHRL